MKPFLSSLKDHAKDFFCGMSLAKISVSKNHPVQCVRGNVVVVVAMYNMQGEWLILQEKQSTTTKESQKNNKSPSMN